MSTMPVRRKRISEVFDLQGIKIQMQYLAIIHNEVCFTLRDESKGEIILQTHKRTEGRLLLADLFGVPVGKNIASIEFTDQTIEISGFVGLRKHSENNSQLFYVNKRVVFNSIIHKFLNSLIDRYFEEKKDSPDESSGLQPLRSNIPKCDYNIYVIQIQCPYSWFELFRNLRRTTVEFKNWDLIMGYLKKAIKAALQMKNLTPDKENRAPVTKRKSLVPKREVDELKNGLKGAFVRRKKRVTGREGVSKIVNATEFDTVKRVYELTEKKLNLPDVQALENVKSSEFFHEFAEWFKERILNDINSYKIYSEFIRDRFFRTSGLSLSRKRRLSGGNEEERKRLKNSDSVTDHLKPDDLPRSKQKPTIVDVKPKKRRNGQERIKKDRAIVKRVRSSFTEVTESEISIQINTQRQFSGENPVLRRNNEISKNLHSSCQMSLIGSDNFKEPANHLKSSRMMKRVWKCRDMQVQTSFMSDKYDKSIQVVSFESNGSQGIDCRASEKLEMSRHGEQVGSSELKKQEDAPSDASKPAASVDSLPSTIAKSPPKSSSADEIPDTLSARLCGSPFTCTERYNFIPRGLSQSGLNKSPRIMQDGINTNKTIELLPGSMFDELEEKARTNMVFCETEVISCTLPKSAVKVNNTVDSFTINKQMLSSVKIVGQWDNKFIVAVIDVSVPRKMKVLTIFDQHAVDERIQLERILKESRRPDGTFVSCCCDPPIKCTLNESSVHFIPTLEDKLLRYGLKATVVDHQTIFLTEIPICLVGENFRDDKAEPVLGSLINDIIEECNETRGTSSVVPTILHTAITTRACKSAVKFNTVLSEGAMKRLMDDLAKCQNPFQCAHGRPCIAPMLDVEEFACQAETEEFPLNFRIFRKS
ncbi:UNVERIFIED_CONTAM: hypothetical protein PYX00_006998 [Menopon gallinae]|uniref:MutL C-terminal dimerisation domain-containing protein n=1 Tax=Menopon gallinae TaxID=328185 RepID=A0AAW2HI25_9NEOP